MRGYLLSAGQHGVAAFPPARSIGQQLNNPLDYRWAMRSLLVAMNRWVTDGTAPPASALPRVDNGTLVTPDKLKFPKVPAVNVPTVPHKAYRADYGPDFIRKGVVTQEPPAIKSAFAILVPQVDADGNEAGRHPHAGAGGAGCDLHRLEPVQREVRADQRGVEHAGLVHSAARGRRPIATQSGDPRRSIEERYRGRDQYLAEITKAANDLVAKGYLLKNDVPRIVAQAGTRWDYVDEDRHEHPG